MTDLAPWALAFVAVVCLVSGFAHGALGFGFPVVATPLVALVIDIKTAIVVLAPVTLLLVFISVVRGGQLLETLRRFWFMPFVMVIGAWVGTRLMLVAPPEPLLLLLAGVIFIYLNLDRLGRGHSAAMERLRIPFGIAFGLGAGATEALANVAGPLLLIYFMLIGLSPVPMVQAMNLCFTFGKSTQVATLTTSGALTPALWIAVAACAVPSVVMLFVGMKVRERIDAATYRRWLRGALWVMAVLLVGRFLREYFR